jgi:hypothetical protein
MRVYNSLGQKVFEKEIMNTSEALDLSSLSEGFYFLQMETNGKAFQEKLVKM